MHIKRHKADVPLSIEYNIISLLFLSSLWPKTLDLHCLLFDHSSLLDEL